MDQNIYLGGGDYTEPIVTQSDEDLDDLESSGKKKKVMVRKSKAKKSKGAAKDKPARKAAVSKAKRVMTPRVPSR